MVRLEMEALATEEKQRIQAVSLTPRVNAAPWFAMQSKTAAGCLAG